MQVNSQMISEEEVVQLLPTIFNLCVKHDIPATFFEVTTALAFSFYAAHNAQVVVLETGLGGRLDATNVVQSPTISVITSIGLEHTRILGNTIDLIAREKGGIIKPGRPILVGPHCPHSVLRDCTKEKGAGPYYVPQDVLQDSLDMEVSDYDEENSRIAKATLLLMKELYPELLKNMTMELLDETISIRPPCRFEQMILQNSTIILDVAHNPPAMEYLVQKLKTTYPGLKFRFVVGLSSDKDIAKCAQSLMSAAVPSNIHLVQAAHPRAATLERMLEAEPQWASCHYSWDDRSISKQVTQALQLARERREVLVVCGSVFLMAEAREALGIDEPRDSDYITEMAGAGLMKNGQEIFGNTTIAGENETYTSKPTL